MYDLFTSSYLKGSTGPVHCNSTENGVYCGADTGYFNIDDNRDVVRRDLRDDCGDGEERYHRTYTIDIANINSSENACNTSGAISSSVVSGCCNNGVQSAPSQDILSTAFDGIQPSIRVTVQETSQLIAHGTTGLRTWQVRELG